MNETSQELHVPVALEFEEKLSPPAQPSERKNEKSGRILHQFKMDKVVEEEECSHAKCQASVTSEENSHSGSSTHKGRQEDFITSINASILLEKYRSELHGRTSMYRGKQHGSYQPKVAESLSKIGLVYQHMYQEHAKSLSYHQRALDMLRNCSESSERDIMTAVTLADVGHVHRALNDNDEALKAYQESISLFDSLGTRIHPARTAALAGIDFCRHGFSST